MNTDYKPIFYNPEIKEDLSVIRELQGDNEIQSFDEIQSQIAELILCREPKLQRDALADHQEYKRLINKSEHYGKWVYYPWSKTLVHLLDENEFIEVRTNRNRNKITAEEQSILQSKSIAIAGLSVGRSAAITIATERIASRLILADFDTLELTNLNRIKSPLKDLGIKKTVATAREIAEIDPYIKIECYHEGLTEDNLELILKKKNVDLFLEECDDLEMKLKSRLIARKNRIPVVMEASDRCLIDIERFDLEPDRPILHGIIDEDDIRSVSSLKTFEEKLSLMSKIVDVNKVSDRMKLSLPEIGNTLRTWPQLSSDVTYGAGVTTGIIRKILLGELVPSARHYFDI